jgi:putative ABC transport system permease protein
MGGVSKISDQFSWLASIIALAGAIFLLIKTMLANLVVRSREIGILKAVGWTERNVQQQLMAEALLQSLAGGLVGLAAGYALSYGLGFLSIPLSVIWEINLLPAFAKEATTTSQSVVRLPVGFSAGLSAVALALSLLAGALASFFMGRRTSRMKPGDILRKL